ncbi:hypothetical protein MKK75_25410 [Methylobacterium sp. J-030]|uniref:hypothetical protein n=1 Tax=Methylobacterium sp. J-030 TaxID=2836627 RepID=UPI001FBA2158|nr:hypothetical protein [Methylobacterium sp. J-030]MCJ2072097.1 hypothetical protein [Methylobacterium sp. J-030]
MRCLVRAVMAISLIAGDAAQAASLTEGAHGPRGAGRQAMAEQARFQDLIDRDTATWKRISASICRGCGAAPPPLVITRAAPWPVRGEPEAVAAAPDPGGNAARPATRPVSLRSAGLQTRGGERIGGLHAEGVSTRRTAQGRRYARSARLHTLRHRRRLALLRAQRRRYARLAPGGRNPAHRLRLAGLGTGFLPRSEGSSGDHRPVPIPPKRPDALCADDRGLTTARIRLVSACVEPR